MSTLFDLTILVITIIFAVWGAKDGLIREIFRFAALLGGFFAGFCYYPDLQVHLTSASKNPQAVSFLAFVIIFLAVAVTILIIGFIIRKIIKFAFLGWLDSFLGLALGVLKAALITWVICLSISIMPKEAVQKRFGDSVVYKTYRQMPAFFSISGIENTRNKIRGAASVSAEKIQATSGYIETLVNSIDKGDSSKTDQAPKSKQKK